MREKWLRLVTVRRGADRKNLEMKVPSIQSIVKWINADCIYRQKIENQKQINDHNGSYNFLFECEAYVYLHKNEIRNCKIVKTKIQTET